MIFFYLSIFQHNNVGYQKSPGSKHLKLEHEIKWISNNQIRQFSQFCLAHSSENGLFVHKIDPFPLNGRRTVD